MTDPTAQHPAPAAWAKQKKTAEELAATILQDLSQIQGCPQRGLKVTAYGFSPFNAMASFGVAAGPVPNKADVLALFDVISERLKRLYEVSWRWSAWSRLGLKAKKWAPREGNREWMSESRLMPAA
jgi:hypothetical protein